MLLSLKLLMEMLIGNEIEPSFRVYIGKLISGCPVNGVTGHSIGCIKDATFGAGGITVNSRVLSMVCACANIAQNKIKPIDLNRIIILFIN